MVLPRNVLIFFEILFFVFVFVQVKASALCNEEMGRLRRAIYPVHQKDLFKVFFNGDCELSVSKEGKEGSFYGEKDNCIFFIIIGQVCNNIRFSEFQDLQVVLMNDIQNIFIVDNCDVPFVVVKILGKICQSLLDLAYFLVLLCIG